MMHTMYRYPKNRTAFETKRTTNGNESLKPQWTLVAAMRQQAMVTHADAPTDRNPVNRKSCQKIGPAKEEQRRNCANVKNGKRHDRHPVGIVGVGMYEGFCGCHINFVDDSLFGYYIDQIISATSLAV